MTIWICIGGGIILCLLAGVIASAWPWLALIAFGTGIALLNVGLGALYGPT